MRFVRGAKSSNFKNQPKRRDFKEFAGLFSRPQRAASSCRADSIYNAHQTPPSSTKHSTALVAACIMAMAMQIRHIKGYNGRITGSLSSHPDVPGQLFYVVGSSLVAMFENNPLRQLQLRGHYDTVTAFAMSPNGAVLASGQKDKNSDVIIWNAQTLTQQFRFQEHDFEVVAVAFSHDSKLLATIGNEQERRVFILDPATGKIVTNSRLTEPKRTRAIAWCPSTVGPTYTFATAADMDVYLWGVNPFSALVHCDKVTSGSVRRTINCLCFSADGAWLFAGTASGDILTINVARKAVQMMHTISGSGIGHMCLSPDKAGVLVGALDGSLSVFDFKAAAGSSGTSCVTAPVAQVPGPISSVCFTAGMAGLAVGTQHGDIFNVQLGAQRLVQLLMQSQQGGLKDLSWDLKAPGSIVTASDDGSVCVWDAQMLGLECRVALPNGVAALSVAASPELLLSGWSDGFIHCNSRLPAGPRQQRGAQLWSIPNAHIRTHATGVTALQLSNRGDFIASGGAGGELRVWDLASREMVVHLKHHSLAITDLKVLSDDAHLMASSEDRSWTIWDIGQEHVTRLFRADMGAVRGLDMAPDQVTAVSVGLDKGVFFWDVRQDKPVRVVPNAHLHEITCCAINARGSIVATGGADCTVKLWDLGTGRALGAFAGHTSTVNKLRFSPDDNQLASVADDSSLVLWKVNC